MGSYMPELGLARPSGENLKNHEKNSYGHLHR